MNLFGKTDVLLGGYSRIWVIQHRRIYDMAGLGSIGLTVPQLFQKKTL